MIRSTEVVLTNQQFSRGAGSIAFSFQNQNDQKLTFFFQFYWNCFSQCRGVGLEAVSFRQKRPNQTRKFRTDNYSDSNNEKDNDEDNFLA